MTPSLPTTPIPLAAIAALQRALSPDRVISSAEDLIVFEYDGTIEKGQPQVVVFPDTRSGMLNRSR